MADNLSRVEDILTSMVNEEEVTTKPLSRVEELLVELADVISGGGGTQGGIILIGETTTQLVDDATTNPITVDGQSYTAQPNDAVIYGNKEFLFDGTKWHEFGDLSGLSSKDIGAMTNYVKAQTGAAIATTDTLNEAIGKVEKRVDVNETNILSVSKSIKSKNLIGTVGGRLYPVNLPEGTTITMSTYDGSTVSTPVQLSFYDNNGNFLNFYGFTVGLSSRTVTITNAIGDVAYIAWSRDFKGQVEIGSAATTYEAYFYDLKGATTEIEKIEAICSEVPTKISGDTGKNIFNVNTINKKQGIYVEYNTGYARANTSFTTYVVPVKEGDVLSFNTGYAHVCGFTIVPDITTAVASKFVIGYVSGFADSNPKQGYTVPAGVVALTVSTTNGAQFQVEKGAVSTEYEPYIYGLSASKVIGISEHTTTTYRIKADGLGDFTDLRECLESITDSSSKNQYEVLIYPGTYDIGALYDDYSVSGLSVPAYTKIIGVGDKNNIILKAELDSPSTAFSVLNPTDNFTIENLTISSKNCRYTIHDDFQSQRDTKSIHIINDCVIIGENCQYGSVYGSGLKGNAQWNFENCFFDANKAAANGGVGNCISVHNNVNTSVESSITLTNCRLRAHDISTTSTYNTLRLLSMTNNASNGVVYMHLYGNYIDGISMTENDASQYGAGCSFYVDGYGNKLPDYATALSVTSSDGIDYSDRYQLI